MMTKFEEARTPIKLGPAVVSATSLASTVYLSVMMIYFTTFGAILHLTEQPGSTC